MIESVKKLYDKYKELILYIIFGFVTTFVNFITFLAATALFGEELVLVNNAIAWVVGVIVAFVTNKLFVFESKSWALKTTFKELVEFTGARLFSFGVEEFGMWFFTAVLSFSDKAWNILGISLSGQIMAKLILAVIVTLMNYFFSKFVIFKKKKQ